MKGMFGFCKELDYLDLSNFNTTNVADMSFMFNNCFCLTEIAGINNFNISNVQNLKGIFELCGEIESIDLTNFNTSNVRDMSFMFNKCHKLKEIKGIEDFKTDNVLNMEEMFQECFELGYLDLSKFDTSKVTTLNYILDSQKFGKMYLL